jgi:orotidine-5'-phosphate decarboxylase
MTDRSPSAGTPAAATMAARRPFGERVVAAVAATGPLCAGIDPSPSLLGAWGLGDDAEGLRRFGLRCVEAFAGVTAAVKPQVAWFERHGAAGVGALEELIAAAGAAGLLVIADAKRGDVDVTTAAYADAWLGEGSPLAADAVTAHAYLGLEALAPMARTARANGRGLLVVARSSNPEGRDLQEAVMPDGTAVGDALLEGIAAQNRVEGAAVGSVGAVVGATLSASRFDLAELGGVVLAPGLGAQGAAGRDVVALFARCPVGTVLPSTSRSLLAAGPAAGDLRAAARKAREDVAGLG